MEDRRFDELTRMVAQSTSRSGVLKGLLATLTGGVLASAASRASARGSFGTDGFCNGRSTGARVLDAVRFCNAIFRSGPERAGCISDAARGTGLYCDCRGDTANVCSGWGGPVCPDFTSDPNHCGNCDNACAGGQPCLDGVCGCAEELTICGGGCVEPCDVSTGQVLDIITCECGCPADHTICDGNCVENCDPSTGEVLDPIGCTCGCPAGQEMCGGVCIDLCDPATGEVHNPTTCTCECPSNTMICNDTCISICDDYSGQVLDTATCECVCPEGYFMLETGFCLQSCTTSDDCPNNQTCDTTTEGQNVCTGGGYLPYCSPCTTSEDCQTGCSAVNTYCSEVDHQCH